MLLTVIHHLAHYGKTNIITFLKLAEGKKKKSRFEFCHRSDASDQTQCAPISTPRFNNWYNSAFQCVASAITHFFCCCIFNFIWNPNYQAFLLSSQQINKEKNICLFIVYSVSSNYQCRISAQHLPMQTGSWSIWPVEAHIQAGTSRRPPSQQAVFFFHGVRFPLNAAAVAEERDTFTEQLNKLQRHHNGNAFNNTHVQQCF